MAEDWTKATIVPFYKGKEEKVKLQRRKSVRKKGGFKMVRVL